MSKGRRYNEEEIAAIFKQAAADFEKAKQNVQANDGLTLEEIKEIGREAGITPEYVAKAAASLDNKLKTAASEKKIASLPIQVKRIVDLPDDFSEADWNRLVMDLHDNYGMTGKIQGNSEVNIRSWVSETIGVYVEPTGSGYRLKVESSNGIHVLMMLLGGIFFFVSMMFMIALMSKGRFMTELDDTLIMFILSAMGLGTAGFGGFKLPSWYREESKKIDRIIERTVSEVTETSSELEIENVQGPQIEIEDEGLRNDHPNQVRGQRTSAK